jgi:rhomboid protease GluP
MRFARAIFARPYIFTIAFLSANIFIFLLMWERSGLTTDSLWLFQDDTLIRFGAKLNALIDKKQEWWRFVTPVFVHGGLIHLLFNMWGLWVLGPYVERLYGGAKFVVFWVMTGVAGVVASYLTVQPALSHGFLLSRIFKAGDGPSVGASGALFGLIGVLLVFGIKFRHELPEGFKRAFGTGMLPTILLNFAIGFSIPVIDNAAHIGGLAAGALLALFVDFSRPGERRGVALFWRVCQILCLLLVAVSFVQVWRHFNDPLGAYAMDTTVSRSDVTAFVSAINHGEREFIVAFNEGDLSGIDSTIAELERAPSLDPQAGQLKGDLRNLLVRERQLRLANPEGESRATEQAQIKADFDDFLARSEEWVRQNGVKYGLTLTKEESK